MNCETPQLTLMQSWSAMHRNSGRTVGFVNGAFDLLHDGHRHLLAYARAHCDRLVVAINSDASVRRRKGPRRPVQTVARRLHQLYAACRIDADIIFDADDPREILAAVRPDLYVLGSDYRDQPVPGAEYCRQMIFLDRLPGISTTAILSAQ